MEGLKLSNIWENFDEFVELCLKSGTISTKKFINTFKKSLDENNMFNGDWDKLLEGIIYVFIDDKRVAKKFDYSAELLETFKIKLNKHSRSTTYKDYKETYDYLYSKLTNQFYNGVQFGSANKFYEQSDIIILTNTIKQTGNNTTYIQAEIVGNTKDLSIFHINVLNNNTGIIYKLQVFYENGIYQKTINLDTNRKTQILKYREIIDWINAKYFNILKTNMSFNEFCYLIKSFCLQKNFKVPNIAESGYLSSVHSSQYLFDINKVIEYCNYAATNDNNIVFSYNMYEINYFVIKRDSDEKLRDSITKTENEWGKARSSNGSRKGRLDMSYISNEPAKPGNYYIDKFPNIKMYQNLVGKYENMVYSEYEQNKKNNWTLNNINNIKLESTIYNLKAGDIITIRAGYNNDMAYTVKILGFDKTDEECYLDWDSYWAPIDLNNKLLQIEKQF